MHRALSGSPHRHGPPVSAASGAAPASFRPAFVAVSLKLYLSHHETLSWCTAVASLARGCAAIAAGRLELAVLPALTAVSPAGEILRPARVALGAQDLWVEDRGPYTGEVSGADLAALGCRYAEIGHAERRRLFGETDALIGRKLAAATRSGLTPLLCVGETERRDVRAAASTCLSQLRAALAGAGDPAPAELVVAYEPVWAIAAEAPAPPAHIATVCAAIKEWAQRAPAAPRLRVIYGGTAGEGLVAQLGDSVDGLFLGRSAHDPARLARVLDEFGLGAR